LDWGGVVRWIRRKGRFSLDLQEIQRRAIQYASQAAGSLVAERTRREQELGAWTLDYLFTAALVESGRSKSSVNYVVVSNDTYWRMGPDVRQYLSDQGLKRTPGALGDIFESSAALAFQRGDFDYLVSVVGHAVRISAEW
jgi:hypothetical protein